MGYLTRRAFGLACLAALGLLLGSAGPAHADLLVPTDARGIRELPGQPPALLSFLSVRARVKWLEKRHFRRTGRPNQRKKCEGQ
jgi:hypothetical protein